MGQAYKKTFGKLIKCRNRATGKLYDDWRTEYLDKPGLIVIARSEKKNPGMSYVYFFLYSDDLEQSYMNTSCGNIDISDDGCEITTENSIYEYAFGDFDLDELAKTELCTNILGQTSLEE